MARVLSQLSSFLQSLTHSTHTTSHAHVPHHAKHDKQTSMLWALALYRVIYYSIHEYALALYRTITQCHGPLNSYVLFYLLLQIARIPALIFCAILLY